MIALVVVFIAMLALAQAAPTVAHPLDPLSQQELASTGLASSPRA
jgi:hypothetical protein